MALKVHKLTLGLLQTNCYLVGDPDSGKAVIIDPAADERVILDVIRAEQWTVVEIWITHAHFDHVLALPKIKAETKAPIKIHPLEGPILESVPRQALKFIGVSIAPLPQADMFLNAGELLHIGTNIVEVRFTPGHSPGHVSFISHADQTVFSGDCLFAGSIGRTDLAGGNFEQLIDSITNQLLTLPDDYRVCSGHGPETTIGQERGTNPFL